MALVNSAALQQAGLLADGSSSGSSCGCSCGAAAAAADAAGGCSGGVDRDAVTGQPSGLLRWAHNTAVGLQRSGCRSAYQVNASVQT
jgi:hypothetical protein